MKFYEEEVLVIPANGSGKLATDQSCGIYECPAMPKGQYYTRANKRTLFIAFRKKGLITHLYKVQDIIIMSLGDTDAINHLDKSGNYPNIKQRLNNYINQTPNLNLHEDKYVFILDISNSIELPYLVEYKGSMKGKAGHEFRKLKEFIRKPDSNGKVLLPDINKP